MPRLTNKGVPLTTDEIQAIKDDLSIAVSDVSGLGSQIADLEYASSSAGVVDALQAMTTPEQEAAAAAILTGVIEVESLLTADNSTRILEVGEYAVNEYDDPVFGDGVTVGGKEFGNGSNRLHVRSLVHIPAATITAGASFQTLGLFDLRETEWTLGQRIKIYGRVVGTCSSAYAGSAFLGFRPYGATGNGFRQTSVFFGTAYNSAVDLFAIAKFAAAAGGGGNIVIDEDVSTEIGLGLRVAGDATASVIVAAINSTSSSNLASSGMLPDVAQQIEMYMNFPQDAAFTGYVRIMSDVIIEIL